MTTRAARPVARQGWRVRPLARLGLLALLEFAAAGTALAQFKVVGPDGRITYTDQAQVEPGGQLIPLRRDAGAAGQAGPAGPATQLATTVSLPAELRPLVARFPVTLYTSADCPPCELGRALLQQRGVPFSERLIGSADDIAALQRLTASRAVPALTVGVQALRGFAEADWQGTLDLAGYPRESRLPRGYLGPAPAPLVAGGTPTASDRAAPVAKPAPVAAPAPVAEPAASGIRF